MNEKKVIAKKTRFKLLWRLALLPGFIFIWLNYFLPIEWGKGRNVAKFKRQYKDAPLAWSAIYTILFWIVIIYNFV